MYWKFDFSPVTSDMIAVLSRDRVDLSWKSEGSKMRIREIVYR